MFNLSTKMTTNFDPKKIIRQINYGTAVGLTKTAKEAQGAVIGALQGTFTLRGSWFQPGNRFGIRIKPATPADPSAEVRTNADWLLPHEEGKNKTARGGNIAIPTDQVRRNKRLIIPRGQRPRGLGAKAFVLQTKKGPVLAQRISRGKRKGLVILYGLKPSVRIRRQSTFYEPIRKVIDRRLMKNITREIDHALRVMR